MLIPMLGRTPRIAVDRPNFCYLFAVSLSSISLARHLLVAALPDCGVWRLWARFGRTAEEV
jgi:hypothetical protein